MHGLLSLSRDVLLVATGLALASAAGCGDDGDASPPARADAGLVDARPEGRDRIALPGDELYPEGIAAAADGTLYVGSFREGTILQLPPGRDELQATTFVDAEAGGLVSTVGLLVDEDRGLLWACSSDPGLALRTGEDAPAVVAFALGSGAVSGRYELPGGGFCNDLSLDEAGNLYVTDSIAPRILVLPAGGSELELWLEDEAFAGEGFNLNGIVSAGDDVYAVKYNSGELLRIPVAEDGSAGDPARVTLDRELALPDGLKLERDGVLLVVEGAGRLSRITLENADRGAVTTVRDGLDGPTTAALVDGDAWVAEGQLGHLFDPSSGEPTLPFELVRVPLE